MYDEIYKEYHKFCKRYSLDPSEEFSVEDFLEVLNSRVYDAIIHRLYTDGVIDDE